MRMRRSSGMVVRAGSLISGEENGAHPSSKATAWHARTVYDGDRATRIPIQRPLRVHPAGANGCQATHGFPPPIAPCGLVPQERKCARKRERSTLVSGVTSTPGDGREGRFGLAGQPLSPVRRAHRGTFLSVPCRIAYSDLPDRNMELTFLRVE